MLQRVLESAIEIWLAGGWAMILLALNALFLFAIGSHVWLSFRRHGVPKVRERVWRTWIDDPERRQGRLGEIISWAMASGSLGEMSNRFAEIHGTLVAPYARDLRFMKRSVSASPLLGLLGTVTGMLSTFAALASGAGGEKTMAMVADGISEALITTETGLVIAIPGLFLQYHLSRERDRYEAFLAHVETVCAQRFYRMTRMKETADRDGGQDQ